MLKRPKKDENGTAFSAGDTVEEKPAPPTPRQTFNQDKYSNDKTTTIGERITIEGNIRGEENLVIEGIMKGNIEMGKYNFSIGPKGRIDGEIHARDVSINGQFKGTVEASGKVAVTREADFNGEIKAKSFSVEDGAYFKGVVELDREPHQKPMAADSRNLTAAPETIKSQVTPPGVSKVEK